MQLCSESVCLDDLDVAWGPKKFLPSAEIFQTFSSAALRPGSPRTSSDGDRVKGLGRPGRAMKRRFGRSKQKQIPQWWEKTWENHLSIYPSIHLSIYLSIYIY